MEDTQMSDVDFGGGGGDGFIPTLTAQSELNHTHDPRPSEQIPSQNIPQGVTTPQEPQMQHALQENTPRVMDLTRDVSSAEGDDVQMAGYGHGGAADAAASSSLPLVSPGARQPEMDSETSGGCEADVALPSIEREEGGGALLHGDTGMVENSNTGFGPEKGIQTRGGLPRLSSTPNDLVNALLGHLAPEEPVTTAATGGLHTGKLNFQISFLEWPFLETKPSGWMANYIIISECSPARSGINSFEPDRHRQVPRARSPPIR